MRWSLVLVASWLVFGVLTTTARAEDEGWISCRFTKMKELETSVLTEEHDISFATDENSLFGGIYSVRMFTDAHETSFKEIPLMMTDMFVWQAGSDDSDGESVLAIATERYVKITGVKLAAVARIELYVSHSIPFNPAMGVFKDAAGRVLAIGGTVSNQNYACDK
jgi:hypothetical protein